MSRPTAKQMKVYWELVVRGDITKENFQPYLECPNKLLLNEARLKLSSVCCIDEFDPDILPPCLSFQSKKWPPSRCKKMRIPMPISTSEVIMYMEDYGDLIPANLDQFLGFVAGQHTSSIKTPLVCLGTKVPGEDHCMAPVVGWVDDKFNLWLEAWDQVWTKKYQFLGRKMSLGEMS